ncbi:MAG TPA: OmpH family outer membrane protein [Fulvivirga sp.]|nr:OmpH family outer membrane protein [Fulvivirga sp.]
MKNISLVLNAILIVAVGVLYYLHFASTNKTTGITELAATDGGDYSVVYINSDSVLTNYHFFKDMQAKLQEKGNKLETEYQNRAQGLQQEVNDYQRTASSLTIGQAKALEENLLKKQQNLRLYQESLSQELMKEEAKMNQQLYDKITAYLSDYSLKNGIDIVVKYNQGSDVLYANKGMDVTDVVVEGLNTSYKTELSGKTVSSDSIKNKL